MTETEQWGETLDGIIAVLQKIDGNNEEFSFFDPFLNESIVSIEKFVEKYIPKENIEFNIEELYDQIKQQVQYCENLGMDKLKAIKTLLNTEPYCYHKELKEKLECELEVLI